MRTLNWSARSPRSMSRFLAAGRSTARAGRGDTEEVHVPAANLQHKEHIQAASHHLHDQHTGDPVAAGDRATAARSTRTDTIAKSLWGSGTPPLFATPRGHDSTSAQAPSSKIDNP